MGFLTELQRRIPDRWFFRRMLPATVYVVVAAVCGGQLGQAHAADVGLARARIAATLRLSQSSAPDTVASLVLVAIAVAALSFAIPVAAAGIDALASGEWPWWLAPLGDRLLRARQRRWTDPRDLGIAAVRARDEGQKMRAARIDARRAAAPPSRPRYYTWSAERLAEARNDVRLSSGLEVAVAWPRLLLVMPDSARAVLTSARDSYDGACEAVAWAVAVVALCPWWWPAAPLGLLMCLAAWRSLRQAVVALCDAATAAADVYGRGLATSPPRKDA